MLSVLLCSAEKSSAVAVAVLCCAVMDTWCDVICVVRCLGYLTRRDGPMMRGREGGKERHSERARDECEVCGEEGEARGRQAIRRKCTE